MQGLHHRQQQLAALLSVALSKDDSTSSSSSTIAATATVTASTTAAATSIATTTTTTIASGASNSEDEDSAWLGAITSLHRLIIYPPNSVVITHSASFLSQVFSQLLTDKSYAVRQSAAVAYGALCAVVCSIPIGSNGWQNYVMLGSMVDRFIGWALPLLSNVSAGDGTTDWLWKDYFSRFFQPHFLDIVDLLLGWALVPDLAESDRCVIMDSFLQFQKHWVDSLQFSLGLLSKFLDDMDVLLQDGSHGTPQQFRRLLALLSCFSTVLQSTASVLLEMNLLEQISEPISKMLPSVVGIFINGWTEVWLVKMDWGFMEVLDSLGRNITRKKFGLLPSSVQKLLQFAAPISQLRLHPNHLITGSSAATYIFLLQHGNDEVVQQAVSSLIEELQLLKGMLGKTFGRGDEVDSATNFKSYSKLELFAFIKFDLKVLLTCVFVGGGISLIGQPDVAAIYLKRSEKLVSFIIEELNPFESTIQESVELQISVIKTLEKLTAVEFLTNISLLNQSTDNASVDGASKKVLNGSGFRDRFSAAIVDHMKKNKELMVKALNFSSPLGVKVAALEWVKKISENLVSINEKPNLKTYFYEAFGYVSISGNMVFSVLEAASDKEPKVRSHVASVLELLLQARLLHPMYFSSIAEVLLERVGDPDIDIRSAFVRLFSHVLPTMMHACGLNDSGVCGTCRPGFLTLSNGSNLHWKQVFALKPLHWQLHSQQLVSVLSYILQRWKVPLSSWIQRLIHSCKSSKDYTSGQYEETGNIGVNDIWLDIKVGEDILERIFSVNNLAGAWWAIQDAARYCIAKRLRTNLGGPTQTFAALERMLLDIAHVLQLDTEQIDGNLSIIGSSGTHLLPMRLLLDFVEALKKDVYNAYEGSAVLPPATRQSSLFFRANKKVCEEWFSRMCEPMMNAGLALQCHDATIQCCTLRLQELRNLVASALKDKLYLEY
ncbi:hypothetical protein Pint_36435 [Pistacia integerrima]|uniref:Uncharacterized protein n=1 Tax=Pistacia integerrima TaxID=434235 RepID=A0ACC0Y6B8_9ROSI|nr:hypothetical protein Pint_36435 [Pistacia integerrima]